MDRRAFLSLSIAATLNSSMQPVFAATRSDMLRAKRLKAGDHVRLVAPAGVIFEHVRIEIAIESMQALGLKVSLGNHVKDRFGYFAGTDKDRAADVNAAFADDSVDAIFALTGGWGCARLLPHLNFDQIKDNPKIVMGYSDITALLNGIYAKTGLVTFHGPNATSRWDAFSTQHARTMLFDAGTPTLKNIQEKNDSLAVRNHRIQTVVKGTASGPLIGGNLTVLTALSGTPYMPDMKGKILFLEDIGEAVYRVDRMLSTLALSGALSEVNGVVFGGFTRVGNDGDGYGAFALMDIFKQYMDAVGKPSFYGAMSGHVQKKFTLAMGSPVTIDAKAGTIQYLESSVI